MSVSLKIVEGMQPANLQKPKHSKIGASSMYRWSKCPGSVRLSQGIPNTSSVYAKRGTAAHEIIGHALSEAFDKNVPTREILQDYWDAVSVYSTYIEKIRAQFKPDDCVIHIEHSFDMSHIFPDLYGQADCIIWHPKSKLLRVIDYKHGAGVPVDVEGNQQVSYYALGTIETLGYRPSVVELTIVQPRCYHPGGRIRSWRVPNTYFIDFKTDLLDAAKETLKAKAKLSAGQHCMFCPAKSICPEKHNAKLSTAKKDFNFYTDPKNDFKVQS